MRRVFVFTLLAAFFGGSAWAQNMPRMTGAAAGAPLQRPSRFAPQGNRSLIGLSGVPFHREDHRSGFGRNAFVYGGWPYFPPEYDNDTAPVVYVQPATAPAAPTVIPAPVRQESVPSAALLELQGNQWVKVTSFATANVATTTQGPPGAAASAKELPPAILVYRDGHTEEVSSYSIIGATLYTKSDYWTSGAWTRKIQVADLDLPATIKQSQIRGLKFDLPGSPDEVILRP